VSTTLAVQGSKDYTVNPGAETDQAGPEQRRADHVRRLRSAATLALTGTGGGTTTVNGTNANDAFAVFSPTSVQIAGRAVITNTTLPTVTLNGYTGDDTFTVTGGHGFTTINVNAAIRTTGTR